MLDILASIFGVSIGMVLDEWFYLVFTDGANNSYFLPISFWGDLLLICLTVVYLMAILFFQKDKSTKAL